MPRAPAFSRTSTATRMAMCALVFLSAAWSGSAAVRGQEQNEFDKYLQAADPHYNWSVVREVEGNPVTTYVVKLTSQGWRTSQDVDRTVWDHWLIVVKPEKVVSNKALLLIAGGSNGGEPPTKADAGLVKIAETTQSVVAELKMVPNQPLVFHNDGKPRKEDDLIGYGWAKFLDTGDATWLPRLPMVKSAVRAMDCIQEMLKGTHGPNIAIDQFVVAGGSKRGWTTWMTAAMDRRVAAIVPIVIDVVNVDQTMRNHVKAYGFWATDVGNYVEHGIMRRWAEPRLKELYRLVDPYFYLDRLTMPKFVLNAAGDQFFTPDSSQFYYHELKGEKLLRYVPNGDHSLRDTDAQTSLFSFYQRILTGQPLPRYSWTFEKDGAIRLVTTDRPARVQLWQATNPKARDFRLMTIGKAFRAHDLEDQGNGVYVGRVPEPSEGWTAFLLELTYDNGETVPLKVSTAVRILPERLPFADIDPAAAPYELDLKAQGR